MSAAFLYCAPVNGARLKVGFSRDDGETAFSREIVKVPVEPANGEVFLKALHHLLQRHSGMHIAKDEYQNAAQDLFVAYSAHFRMPEMPSSTTIRAKEIASEATSSRFREFLTNAKYVVYEKDSATLTGDLVDAFSRYIGEPVDRLDLTKLQMIEPRWSLRAMEFEHEVEHDDGRPWKVTRCAQVVHNMRLVNNDA